MEAISNESVADQASEENTQATEQTENQQQGYTQEEFDQFKAELLQQQETEMEKAVAEALRKAKMTEDEAAVYEREQKEKALAEKEQALLRRELQSDAKTMLAGQGLPLDMLEFTLGENQVETERRISRFKEQFDRAVQDEVARRFAGKTPAAGSATDTGQASVGGSFLSAIKENQAKRR